MEQPVRRERDGDVAVVDNPPIRAGGPGCMRGDVQHRLDEKA